MKITNLENLMISLADVRGQLADIINNKKTKVIIKNNQPTSIIMPYSEYAKISSDPQVQLHGVGEDITLSNGVQIKTVVDTNAGLSGDRLAIKTYIKMKTSGEYTLLHMLELCHPREESALTIEEQVARYNSSQKDK